MLKNSGVAERDLVEKVYPSEERRKKGAFAAIECFQRIPCDPCVASCKRGAISPPADINDIPTADFDKCNGCGLCISVCPGLAIFVIDENYSVDEALIKLPYEFLPLPIVGDIVFGTDRGGSPVCKAKVVQVVNTKSSNRTPVVSLAVPKELSMDVRGFCFDDGKEKCECDCANTQPHLHTPHSTLHTQYICRCEGITLDKIREYVAHGYTTLNEIKIISRAGMGACQGRTCRQLILNELAKTTGQPIDKMPVSTFRPPVQPIKMGLLLSEEEQK